MSRKPEDLTNKQFGEWTALEYLGHSTWKCRCSCGTISNVGTYALKNGKSTKCNSPLHRMNEVNRHKYIELKQKAL